MTAPCPYCGGETLPCFVQEHRLKGYWCSECLSCGHHEQVKHEEKKILAKIIKGET